MGRLFDCLDVDNSGAVCLDDLQKREGKIPVAIYWKLLFVTNWGSATLTSLCAPLRFFCLTNERCAGMAKFKEQMTSHVNESRQARQREEDMCKAFDMKNLDVSMHQIMLRELARK